MKSTIAVFSLVFSSLITLVFGQSSMTAGIAINSPILNETVYGGSNLTITWTITDENATTIDTISLMDGNSLALDLVIYNILTNGPVNVSDQEYIWTVPTNLSSREDYVLSMRGNNSYYTYSDYFTIINNNVF
ncbi:MAG: hypothetical protein EXX96DRAFT_562530 [Benjaminiella poitrasii]|nr:MAG: hypothetical protein EXX96DRAFT_562530 [Benjaminiella poitrasii]